MKVISLEMPKHIKIQNKNLGALSYTPLLISIMINTENTKTNVEKTLPTTRNKIRKISLLI